MSLNMKNRSFFGLWVFLIIFFLVAFTSKTTMEQPQAARSIKPPFLTVGDKVGIIAPAFWANRGEEALQKAIAILQSWGLQVLLGPTIYAKHGVLAGNDQLRKADLQAMFDDPSIKAIFAYRGGYGTNRIIDDIDFTGCLKHPKWFVGFSDMTTVHLKLHQLGIVSVHGEMVCHFHEPQYKDSVDSLRSLLFGKPIQVTAQPDILNNLGTAKAPVVGGNLMMLCTNIGTSSDLDTKGKILFIEDVDEKLYALDRMIVHLKRSGKLDHLAGLVIGTMSDMKDYAQTPFGKDAYSVIKEHLANYNYPIAFNFPIGHTAPNMAILHGDVGQLTVGKEAVMLSFDEQGM
jgi:muramoyltetrapeptide carboxypeptidase